MSVVEAINVLVSRVTKYLQIKRLENSTSTNIYLCDQKIQVEGKNSSMSPRGGHSIVKLITTCEQSLLPLYYMP